MTSRNDVPRDVFKETTDSQDTEKIPSPDQKPVAKEKELLHSFEWSWSHKKQFTNIACNQPQTIENCLKKSQQFRVATKKEKGKELVIIRDGKAIASHFPCILLKNERLTLKFVKAADKPNKQFSDSAHPCTPSSELVLFHVLTRGGSGVVKILKNPELRKLHEITVYAYKGEKVKQALRRDGRFLNTIFKKNCVLSDKNTDVNTEMGNLVDDLDDKTFEIKLLNKSNPPDSQPGSLDDAYIELSESQASDAGGNEALSQQSNTAEPNTAELKNDNKPVKKLDLLRSKKFEDHLCSQFKDVLKGKKTQVPRLSRIQNLFRLEFGSNAQRCQDVKTMRKLMHLSNSVCQVRVNGKPCGSGFLLFSRFVLTNAHVIKNDNGWLYEGITVIFSYESLEQNQDLIEVEEVVGYDYCPDFSGTDWALLRISAGHTLPDGLLTHCGFDCHSGGICIIGHPNGGVKRIDPCLIVSAENRMQAVEKHYRDHLESIQLVTRNFFERVAQHVQQHTHTLTYDCGSYHGSSGSPVFNEDGNVVAMHSGGYPYNDDKGQTQSVIEYGYKFSDLIKRIIIQMVERRKFDVLKEFLSQNYSRQHDILAGVKKLVENNNLTAFKNAVNNSEAVGDESLRAFYDFFSVKETPEPMDTD